MVDTSEWLTRGTVWLALALYVAAEVMAAFKPASRVAARWLSTLGSAAFLLHVLCAFHFYHHWSHGAAYADTARQTAAFSGWNWGGGLYLNYCFTLLWLGDVIWGWLNPTSYAQRNRLFSRFIRGFFFFMIFNGAVLFARGPTRWFGLIICLTLVACWWQSWKLSQQKVHSDDAN